MSVDLAGIAGLRDLDTSSGLATFGAGTIGPAIEAALAEHGLTLGHYPQSFEHSTVGGWVVTRSAGQESIGYGRIERLFAGGHVETPAGPLDLRPFPASAAGPDLRQLVLGSEGRLGIMTDVVVRAIPTSPARPVRAFAVPDWSHALDLARSLAQAGAGPLDGPRLDAARDRDDARARRRDRARRWLRRYLGWRRRAPDRCLVLVGIHGPDVRRERRRARSSASSGGLAGSVSRVSPRPGDASDSRRRTCATRCGTPGTRWTRSRRRPTGSALPALAAALGPALRHGLDEVDERVHAFSHLSHVYPTGSSLYTTYVFRRADDPDETLERWRRLKRAASDVIVAHGGTISHQHGIGVDHAPYLAAEKGALGIETVRAAVARLDPDGIMHPGVLLDDAGEAR